MTRILMIAVLALCAGLARPDIVTLRDGSTHEGKVIEENGARVVLEVTISNIKTTKTFARYKVKSIEYKPVEEAQDDQGDKDSGNKDSGNKNSGTDDKGKAKDADKPKSEGDKQSTPGTNASDTDGAENDATAEDAQDDDATPRRHANRRGIDRTLFMVIPVEGMIGEDTNATGLRNALMQARRKHVEHIVFTIDSPGGYIYDAVETLKLLKEFDDEFEYHAYVIEGAISAASVFVAASDDIWVRPDARVGGAVSYSKDQSTGAAEVDAKMNSIWAAEIAARAESKGYPPELFRAMAEPGAEVWIDADNKVYPSRPSSRGAQQLDSASTVFTMRAGQMIQLGMAHEFKGDPEALGEALGLDQWYELKGMGQRLMKASAKERTELRERFDRAIKVFRKAYDEIQENDPASYSDYRFYVQSDGRRYPDGTSMQKWRERTDLAVRNCDEMLAALTEIASVNKQAKKIGALHLVAVPNDMGHEAYLEIKTIREKLLSKRSMGT